MNAIAVTPARAAILFRNNSPSARRNLFALALAGLFVVPAPSALAATIEADGIICALADAIAAVNTNAIAGGCPAGSGSVKDAIILPEGSTLNLLTGLPNITSDVAIEGRGATVRRGAPAPTGFSGVAVTPGGNQALKDPPLRGGRT
ncbi:MAG: hypothetical protein ACT4QA_21245, partial [Panacagrimonas sp.]